VTSCTRLSCPPVNGLVLEVNEEQGLVVIAAGTAAGVHSGCYFDVIGGAHYKGLIRITQVEEDHCVGLILRLKKPIEVGDSMTRL
jgi:hypothetical protein